MDFQRFSSTQRYGCRVPLRQLAFRVTVSRAFLVEEERQDILCATEVMWDAKVPSPEERLKLYQQAEQAAVAVTSLAAQSNSPSSTTLQQHQQAAAAAAAGAAAPSPQLTPLQDLIPELETPSFFTRPCMEDFIDVNEEDFPVDPPQGPSRLAPVILRQHRADHQPNRTMYLMWAMGDIERDDSDEGNQTQAQEMNVMGSGSGGGGGASSRLQWVGQERVMCAIAMERDGNYFTAKPSLSETHTLIVDATYIYSFRVDAVVADPSRAAGGMTAHRLMSTDVEELLALCDDVEALHSRLQTKEKQQSTRRLLHDAATMATDTRLTARERASADIVPSAASTTSPAGTTTPAKSLFASELRGGRSGLRPRWGTPFLMSSNSQRAANKRSQYHVFGTVDRCVGVGHDTLFLRCQLQQDSRPVPLSSPRDGLSAASSAAAEQHTVFTTQLAFSGLYADDDIIAPDHVFNAPFEHSYVDDRLATAPLRLIVTALTEGSGATGHQAPVGYCAVTLPTAVPGRHQLRCSMWAPHQTGKEFVESVVVGGAPSLVDPRQSGPSLTQRTGISVKSGMVTDSVGTLILTVNILQMPATQ